MENERCGCTVSCEAIDRKEKFLFLKTSFLQVFFQVLSDPLGDVGSCAPLDLGGIFCKEAKKLLSGQAGAWDCPALRCVLLLQGPDAFGKSTECL